MADSEMSANEYFRQREEELLKLNAKLEEQKYRIFSENARPAEAANNPAVAPALLRSSGPAGNFQLPANPAEVESLQSTVRYQKARIAALQEELERVNKLGSEKDAEIASLRLVVKEATEETKKQLRRISGQEVEAEKQTRKTQGLETRTKLAEEEVAEMKKQKDVDDNAIKKLEAQLRTNEVKISRAGEETERLRQTVKDMKTNERDKMTVDKDEVEKLQGDVKRLTKQRTELMAAFKKQAKLVDVLRRQKAHIEASRLLNFTEDEFTKIFAHPAATQQSLLQQSSVV